MEACILAEKEGFAFLRKSHGGCNSPRTVAKSRLSNPSNGQCIKKQLYLW